MHTLIYVDIDCFWEPLGVVGVEEDVAIDAIWKYFGV